jgi:hypothetical protein
MQNNIREKMNIIREQLAEPCHSRSNRETGYRANMSLEADLSQGWMLAVQDVNFLADLKDSLIDFRKFMSVSMALSEKSDNYRIIIRKGSPSQCPADSPEAFEVRVSSSVCELIARESAGIRRGLIFLEDQMSAKRSPVLPLGKQVRWTSITDRITRSPIAAYRWNTGWELLDDYDYYPEEYLNKLMHCGINGIWVAGLFRTLIHTEILPELGPTVSRLEKLKDLVKNASRFGIKVYMFCIEPRAVDENHPVFQTHPEIRGAINSCLCTSTPLVQEYIRQVTCELFKQVPELGGIINLFNGERITNCWLGEEYVASCPRCRERKQIDVLAEDLNCFAEGIQRSGSKGRCLAWTYCMSENSLETASIDPMLKLMEKTDSSIVWLGNFEHGGKKVIGGKEVPVDEYSLSFTGPSDDFCRLTQKANQEKQNIFAKLQIGTTFELSSVPYLPVPGIVYDKIKRMKTLGVTGTILSWIPGGIPSPMLKAAGEAVFNAADSKEEFLKKLSRVYWPMEVEDLVVRAWTFFENSFQEYPFTNRLFYFGPITRAPAYPLMLPLNPNRANPYNWGINRDRITQPFEEEYERWLSPFTVDEMLRQLDKMIHQWNQGLQCLELARKNSPDEPSEKQMAVATAVHVHFCCTKNVIEFLACRKSLMAAENEDKMKLISRMKEILKDQIQRVSAYKLVMAKEPTLGYQSEILDFSYDVPLLDQAIEMNKKTLSVLEGPEDILFQELQKRLHIIPEKPYCPDVDANGD